MVKSSRGKVADIELAPAAKAPWDRKVCLDLIGQLTSLRGHMLEREAAMSTTLAQVAPRFRGSARNLVHYLCLRGKELRSIQDQLAWLGLSSLGRSESHVLANLDKVLGILHRLTGQDWQEKSAEEPAGMVTSRQLLERNADLLLGPTRATRSVRIMVTLAPEAAQSLESVQHLVDAGMDIARINCAHDSPADWKAMAQRVRQAGKAAGREVRILMDLGGPKIRTGAVMPRSAVLKLRPQRDEYGRVVHPSRLRLFAGADVCDARGVEPSMQVDAKWLSGLSVGTQVYFADARGAKRHLLIVETSERGAVAETLQTAYITPQTELTLHGNSGKKKATTRPVQMQVLPGILHLHIGDRLRLTREGAGRNAIGIDTDSDAREDVAHISCTLSQVIDQARTGERIWFDDGKIGGVIVDTKPHWLEVEITHAREGGEKLAADKGINLPDSVLRLPALTERDIEDLKTVVTQADLVGLSFVRNPQDIDLLRHHLKELKCPNLGIVLKIETPQAFENLPALMFSAMGGSSAGVMIARGDLAVECGYERLAEVQEEILWCAEAAHMPVIWATQVLETMAKTGIPSRAEVSDASLGVRAECVMLNKGPYIVDAIRTLDDILLRMGGHQAKKRPLLRALHAWSNAIGSPDFPVTEMAPKTRKKSLRQSR